MISHNDWKEFIRKLPSALWPLQQREKLLKPGLTPVHDSSRVHVLQRTAQLHKVFPNSSFRN